MPIKIASLTNTKLEVDSLSYTQLEISSLAHTQLDISSLSYTQPEIDSLAYTQLKIASLVYTELGLSKLTYVDPIVGTAYIDYNPSNKILHDVSVIVEQYLIDISLSKVDNMSATDVYAIAIEKAASDLAGVVDHYSVDVSKGITDRSVVLDALRVAINKAFHDAVGTPDSLDITTIKSVNDSLVSTDVFSLVVDYVRRFSDYMSIDDFAGIDKYYNGVKHNVVGTLDFAAFALSMLKEDTVGAFDVIDSISTGKNLNDVVALSEALRKISTHVMIDSALVSDMTSLYLSKYLSDDVVSTVDASTINCMLTKNDAVSTLSHLSKSMVSRKVDLASLPDATVLHVQKYVQDNYGIFDAVRSSTGLGKTDVVITTDLLNIRYIKDLMDVVSVSDALSKSTNKGIFNNISPVELVSLATITTKHDYTPVMDSIVVVSLLPKADTTGILDTIARWVTTNHNDTVGTADTLDKSIVKMLFDGVALDDSMSFGDITATTKNNITVISDILQIQTSKGATDAATALDTITVLYTPGNLMLFNSTLFNESTFG